MTLLNVTALADGKITDEEKKLIFDTLKKQFVCTDEELEKGFAENMAHLKEDTTGMIKDAVLVMREVCSGPEIKNVLTLMKKLAGVDADVDRREMMIIELLEQLTEEKS